MELEKSFVLTSALPSSAKNPDIFEEALILLKERNISTVEYFVDFDIAEYYKPILNKYGISGIYLAAAYQKKNNLSLCSTDDTNRFEAVRETLNCYDAAIKSGASGMLITSGKYPGISSEVSGWEKLKASVIELLKNSSNDFFITMEPGDRSIDACQLSGPTNSTLPFAQFLHDSYKRFWLTMDTSHLAQLGENAILSIEKTKNVCNHIHLANCVLKPEHPLYGDKHPMFSFPDAFYSLDDIKMMISSISEIYSEKLTMSVEIINREKEEWNGFMSILKEEEWFFYL